MFVVRYDGLQYPKSIISICFSKIAGAPIGSLKFLGSKEESMACALRRYEVTDSGLI
ncbi:MAG: hypothetical protein P8X74_02245 [Reinekea sp.]